MFIADHMYQISQYPDSKLDKGFDKKSFTSINFLKHLEQLESLKITKLQ